MSLKKIMRYKTKVTPSRDFDKKFWDRFEKEFEKENSRFSSWSYFAIGGAVAALVVLFVALPQFSKQFQQKEIIAQNQVETQKLLDEVADDLVSSNEYLLDDLDISDLLDDEDKIADTSF